MNQQTVVKIASSSKYCINDIIDTFPSKFTIKVSGSTIIIVGMLSILFDALQLFYIGKMFVKLLKKNLALVLSILSVTQSTIKIIFFQSTYDNGANNR